MSYCSPPRTERRDHFGTASCSVSCGSGCWLVGYFVCRFNRPIRKLRVAVFRVEFGTCVDSTYKYPTITSSIGVSMNTQNSPAGRCSAIIEMRYPVAAHARGHNLKFGAPVESHLVQGVGTKSSGRAMRRTGVPRRSYSTSSSYSSSSSSMLPCSWRGGVR